METAMAPQDPLERLPAQVNTVVCSPRPTTSRYMHDELTPPPQLTHIGLIFQQAPRRHDVRLLGQGRAHHHEAIVQASCHFHEALDELEMEILHNKSVLERDLQRHRARRAERERALKAETQPSPQANGGAAPVAASEAAVDPPAATADKDGTPSDDDIVMVDPATFDLPLAPAANVPPTAPIGALATAASGAPAPKTDPPAPSSSSATSSAPAATAAAATAPIANMAPDDALGASFVAIPPAADLPAADDDDLASIFGSASAGGGTGDDAFELDFSALDGAGGTGAGDPSEDIDALMPGLDDIVGAPPAGTIQPGALTAAAAAAGGRAGGGGVAPVADMSRGSSGMGAAPGAGVVPPQQLKQQQQQQSASKPLETLGAALGESVLPDVVGAGDGGMGDFNDLFDFGGEDTSFDLWTE